MAAFRAETARAGATESVKALVEELCALNPEFEKLWKNNEVQTHGDGTKKIYHPKAGLLTIEYSSFAVDGRPDLTMVVYNPATPEDKEKIRALVKSETWK